MQIERLPLSVSAEQLTKIGEKQVAEQAAADAQAQTAPLPLPPAAKETVVAEEGSKHKWRVPKWEKGFRLDDAMEKAVHKAATYMQKKLTEGELELTVNQTETGYQGTVRQTADGAVKYTYNARQMLAFMAQQTQQKGVVVDGAV